MKRDYDEQNELRRYIWRNYFHALSEREKTLHHAAILELKARHTQSESRAASYRKMDGYFYDAEVAGIAQEGIGIFERRCCHHLAQDYTEEIYVNRCDRCHRIVASPIACACLWCGHHWYERRPEMLMRAKSSIYPKDQAKL